MRSLILVSALRVLITDLAVWPKPLTALYRAIYTSNMRLRKTMMMSKFKMKTKKRKSNSLKGHRPRVCSQASKDPSMMTRSRMISHNRWLSPSTMERRASQETLGHRLSPWAISNSYHSMRKGCHSSRLYLVMARTNLFSQPNNFLHTLQQRLFNSTQRVRRSI